MEIFEGSEKKLEIILFSPKYDLRSDTDKKWEKVVKAAKANIISRLSTDKMDAYLLSESSLFVWDDRILMITCGKTTLIQSLPEILKFVEKSEIAFVFYERKNNLFPHEQPSDFEEDVIFMTDFFPGKFYKLGPVNKDHVNVFYSSHANARAESDATLQLLMHDLDPDECKWFYEKNAENPVQVYKCSGLEKIYPHMITDSFLFSPYGYSLNGIYDTRYFTVHVTPQPTGSYASFETNAVEKNCPEIINKVISAFNPGRFSLVLTTSMDKDCLLLHSKAAENIPYYRITDKTLYEFDCGYSVTFLNYIK